MCGLFGVFSFGQPISGILPDFEASIQWLKHRGPDASAVWTDNKRVAIGHTRLSIIDLSPQSNQPFSVDDRYKLVYNGELFNYIEIRKSLEAVGVRFQTESDTEVLLRSYIAWGPSCVDRFNGMWAFAIFDSVKQELFLSRDRFGIKPLLFSRSNSFFAFASESKPLLNLFPSLRVPNYQVIGNFCRKSLGAQCEKTWFEGIDRIKPATNLIVRRDGHTTESRYWDYPIHCADEVSRDTVHEFYGELFNDAVRIRLRSDVPVGITLSAGLDSTSIAYVASKHSQHPLHTYTATYTEGFRTSDYRNYRRPNFSIDEASTAEEVARELHYVHHPVAIDYTNVVQSLSDAIYYLESGNSSPAIIPVHQIMKEARQYTPVVLEGQGADETLGGYINNVIPFYIIELLKQLRARDAIKNLSAFMQNYSLKSTMAIFVRKQAERLPIILKAQQLASGLEKIYMGGLSKSAFIKDSPPYGHRSGFDLASNLRDEHRGGLVNLLHYGDALSMAAAVESRLPFLDHRLVEFAFRLPSDLKVHDGHGKYIHRLAMKAIVPESICWNRIKLGFPSPISSSFATFSETEDTAAGVLLSNRTKSRGLFNTIVIRDILAQHRSGRGNFTNLLFRLLSCELWFRQFID